jgi:predicted ribosome quality control (RQC) complex YloA/Tae2 family protein
MKILSSLEISCVVKELQDLVDARINKVYQPNQSEIVLALHRTGIGKVLLRIVPGQCLYITEEKLPSPKTAFNFCMFLRKRLTNTRLRSIEQKDFERIVEFTFESKDEHFKLIAEFFSKGNVILCDRDYNIISALQVQLWKDRQIKARVEYKYPPKSNVDIFNITLEEFTEIIKKSKKDNIVKTLAVDIGLGGLYAEELCLRAKVDKEKKPTQKDIEKIFKELKDLSYLNIKPSFLGEDAVPFEMLFYKDAKTESKASFNEALNLLYSQSMEIEKEDPYQKKIEEQNRIFQSQELQIKEMERGKIENKEKGDLIYTNYQFIKEVLETIKKARDKKVTWDEIESKLKTKGIIVKGREGLVTLDLK